MLYLLLLIFISSISCQIPCSSAWISESGVWPKGATTMQNIPDDTDCVLRFAIPDNFIVKLTTFASYQNNNAVIVEDAGGVIWEIPPGNGTRYLPAATSRLYIIPTPDSALSLFVQYDFINITNTPNQRKDVGTYVEATSGTLYTFYGDNVVLRYDDEIEAQNYFVYGDDNKYIGTLDDFGSQYKNSASQNSVRIVSFYPSILSIVVVSAELATISKYSKFELVTFAEGLTIPLQDFSNNFAAYSIICKDCTEVYINSIQFDPNINAVQNIQFFGLKPDFPILTYSSGVDYSYQLSQQIPVTMFTIVVQKATVTLNLSTVNPFWTIPELGKKIVIYSPSYWNTMQSRFYYYDFLSTEYYQFKVTFNYFQTTDKNNDFIDLEIGDGTNNTLFESSVSCVTTGGACTKSDLAPVYGTGTFATLLFYADNINTISMTTIEVLAPDVVPTPTTGPPVAPACSSAWISNSGTWPQGATGPQRLPDDTDCVLRFAIPDGYILQLTTVASYQNDNAILVEDVKGEIYQIPNGNATRYLPATTSRLFIIPTVNTSLSFIVQYEFVNIADLPYHLKSAGTYAEAVPRNLYIFSGDNLALRYDDVIEAQNYFVYGDDNKYIATLDTFGSQYQRMVSQYSVRIVSFYPSLSSVFVVAEESSVVSQYSKFELLTFEDGLGASIRDFSDNFAAYTIICKNCTHFYINSIQFDETINPDQGVQIFGFKNNMPILTYSSGVDYSSQFPQQIPVTMFTIVVQKAELTLNLVTVNNNWLIPQVGRKIVIYSPSYWNTMQSRFFFHDFLSANYYQFKVTFNYFQTTAKNSDYIDLEIGDNTNSSIVASSVSCTTTGAACTKNNLAPVYGTGTFARLLFVANNVNTISMTTIEVLAANIVTTPTTTTTPLPVTTPTTVTTSTTTVPSTTTPNGATNGASSSTTPVVTTSNMASTVTEVPITTTTSGVVQNHYLEIVIATIMFYCLF